MENARGIERLIFFTDAVVAIAITLLILPLVDIVTSDAAKSPQPPLTDFLGANVAQFYAFVLSFVIIARFWMANHEILLNTRRVTAPLMWLDVAWVFTIVILPVPTEITAAFDATRLTTLIYIGTTTLSTLLLTAIAYYLHRHPELQTKEAPIGTVAVWGIGSTAVAFVIAFAVSWIFPDVHYYSLFILLLTFPLDLIVKPLLRSREAAKTPN